MKSRAELEVELEEIKRQITPASKQLDNLVTQFAISIAPDVKEWIKKEAIRQIEENHAKVNEMGVDFVRNVKAEVMGLLENVDSVCVEAIGPQDQWPHNKDLKEQDFYASSHDDFFAVIFRRAVSSLGKILGAHGLLGSYAQSSSWRRVSAKEYEYSYHTGFDPRKNREASSYRELLRTHSELKKAVSRIEVSIEKAKTRDLWDEA